MHFKQYCIALIDLVHLNSCLTQLNLSKIGFFRARFVSNPRFFIQFWDPKKSSFKPWKFLAQTRKIRIYGLFKLAHCCMKSFLKEYSLFLILFINTCAFTRFMFLKLLKAASEYNSNKIWKISNLWMFWMISNWS